MQLPRGNLRDPKTEGFKKVFLGLAAWDNCQKSMVMRIVFLAICFACCFMMLAYRLISVSLNDAEQQNNYAKSTNFRRDIVDRNGNLLAINLPNASVFANPSKMIDPNEAISKLATILPNLNKTKLLADFKSDKSFVWIKRDLTPEQQTKIHRLGIPGVYFEQETSRVYTHGNLLSHILGYVGRDNEGLAGLERAYNEFLTTNSKETAGKPLKLTIDVRVQDIVSDELEKSMAKFRAVAGVAIVVDPKTGAVIASVSKPDFNPHLPSEAKAEQLFNRFSGGVFEIGSVMKTIAMAIGLDSDKVQLNDAYDLTALKVANFQLKDTHKMPGWHSVPEILVHSSNIGIAQIVLEVGAMQYRQYIQRLGLLDKLPIELPEKATPLYPPNSIWQDLSIVTMSYGYGLSISPMHYVNAMIPIVNGGIKKTLHFIEQEAPEGERVLKQSTSDDMIKLLHLTAAKGTARKANVPNYLVAGKTGTAEKREGRRYVKNARMTSFIGTFPAVDPQYMLYVMLDNPQAAEGTFGFTTSGWNAAPLARNIIERMITLFGMSPYDPEDKAVQEKLYVEYQLDEHV